MTGHDRSTPMSDRPTRGPDDLGRRLRSHFRSVGDDFPAPGQLAAVVARTRTVRPRPTWLASLLVGGPRMPWLGATGDRGAVEPNAPTWLGAPALGSTAARQVAIVLVLLALLFATALGAAMVGGWLPDPRRADLPPAVPSAKAKASATANPRPTSSLAPTTAPTPPARSTSPVTSERYGYSIELTRDWQIAQATRDWTGPGRPAASMSDAYLDPRAVARFTIAARTKPAEASEDRFVADAAPLPANVRLDGPDVRCVFGYTVLERGPIPPWETEVIGGHRARVRSMCGTVDAVVFVGDRGYLFTLVSGERTVGDLERFRQLVASVRFDDGRTTFVSDEFGYSVRIPGDWQATPASRPWAGGIRDDQALDRFTAGARGPTPQFTVTARAVDAALTEADWIGKFVPRITQVDGTVCRFGSAYVLAPDPDASWHPATIDGRDALVRGACGRIDGVVFSNGIGYWMRLTTSERRTGADLAAFYLLADAIDLDAVPPSLISGAGQSSTTPSQTFTSGRNGYTIRYPADWTVEAASKVWSGAGSWRANMADQFTGPEPPASQFTVAARAAPEGVDPAWLDRYVPTPASAQGKMCIKGGSHFVGGLALSQWVETTIAGRPARMRSGCGDAQAVLTVGETAYVLSLATPTLVGGDVAFRQIADTFRIAP